MKDLSLHIMDIAQNSIVAGASRIRFILKTQGNPLKLVCEFIDNGRGMDMEFLKEVTDPFKTSRSTRDVGLGIPLLKQSAEMADGELFIQSEPFKGTLLRAEFAVNHIDRIPLGDVPGTFAMLIMANPKIGWMIEFLSQENAFMLDTDEIKNELGDVPLDNYDVVSWIQNAINEGIVTVFGGVLDEVS